MSAAAAPAAQPSTSTIAELVDSMDAMLRKALEEGRCHEETINHRKEFVRSASRRVLPHACTNLLQAEILKHPEYDEMRRTYPAYLWGYSARFRDARLAKNLTPEFYEKEREHLTAFDGRTQGPKTTQPNASSQQDELSTPLRRMSLQPEIPHRSASGGGALPLPQIECEKPFTDIEDEPGGLCVPEAPRAGPSKRKLSEEDEARMVVDDIGPGAAISTNDVKRRRNG